MITRIIVKFIKLLYMDNRTVIHGFVLIRKKHQQKSIHSVSEHKKRHIRNYTQILENLRNAIVFFWSKKQICECPSQENKKHNTQNIQVKKQKINTHLNFSAL